MKNLFFICSCIFLIMFSCTPEGRKMTQQGARDITQKEFKIMLDNGEVDHVEASEKDVYIFLTEKAAQRRDVLQAPQFHLSIESFESFKNEMESLDREYLVHPAK